jgi:hypothetical protein
MGREAAISLAISALENHSWSSEFSATAILLQKLKSKK